MDLESIDGIALLKDGKIIHQKPIITIRPKAGETFMLNWEISFGYGDISNYPMYMERKPEVRAESFSVHI
jgi:hypothetical protein